MAAGRVSTKVTMRQRGMQFATLAIRRAVRACADQLVPAPIHQRFTFIGGVVSADDPAAVGFDFGKR